ncbi:uncharacterized protein TNCV_3768841 [Trichonephila clavipes]|nr:uncharacterized protein TNCV_3768841 [Trichonephila clavipes]
MALRVFLPDINIGVQGRVDDEEMIPTALEQSYRHSTRFNIGQLNFLNPECRGRLRKDLKVKFYSERKSRGQEPTDFIYYFLKVYKKLGLKISEEELVDHTLTRLEPQVQDYVEVRNPTTTVKLLQVISKFEERYSCRKMQISRINEDTEKRDWDIRRMSNDKRRQRNWRDTEVVHRPNDRRNSYRGTYGNGLQGNRRNQGFESRKRFDRDI